MDTNHGISGRRRPAAPRSKVSIATVVGRETRAKLIVLTTRDNWRNIFYVGGDWLVIGCCAALSMRNPSSPFLYLLALIVIGSRQRALLNLVHEAAHYKLFASRRLNEVVGRAFVAYPVLVSLSAYRSAHRRHHGWLWDPVKDPDALDYEHFGLRNLPGRWSQFVRRHVLGPALLKHLPYNLRSLISSAGGDPRETLWRLLFLAAVATAITAAGGWQLVVLYWVSPLCTSLMVVWYLAFMGKHAGLESDDPFEATRTWTGSLPARWLLAPHRDDLYHLVHHLFPAIPHYRLRRAHKILMTEVPVYAAGHHCDGFFFPRRPEAPSVLQDILHRPQLANARRGK